MNGQTTRSAGRAMLLGVTLLAAAGCANVNLPGVGNLDSSGPQRQPVAERPQADARGVISYPTYQVAEARGGDTVTMIAGRLGLDPANLARANGLPQEAALRPGELVLLPRRVDTVAPGDGGTALSPGGGIDVATLAGNALDRAEAGGGSGAGGTPAAAPRTPARVTSSAPAAGPGPTPQRHTVVRGETAYSIARLYDTSVRALSDWNALDASLTVREGQTLLIPVPNTAAPTRTAVLPEPPGAGSATPVPPSASAPQPAEVVAPASQPPAAAPSGALAGTRTAASDTTRLGQPVSGRIIRGYDKGKNEGLDFAAPAGTPVRAAADGTVAAITRDVDQVPILVLRHDDGLLTVYANIDDIKVAKGASVRRGQDIAAVRAADPAFLRFEVRRGFDSLDPVDFLSQ